MNEKHIFSDNDKARQLCNIFIDSSPELLEVNIQDLLSISKVGQKRIFSAIYFSTPNRNTTET